MIKYKGFTQLRTIGVNEENIFLEGIRKFNPDLILPLAFELFLESFDIQPNNIVFEKYLFKNRNLFDLPFEEPYFSYSKLGLSDFLDVEVAISYMNREEKEVGKISVGNCGGINGRIQIKINGENKEEVSLMYNSQFREIVLSKNIFFFIREYFNSPRNPSISFEYNLISKYWGNQYWTPKGNEDVIPFDSHPIPGAPFYRYIPERGFTFIGTRKIDDDFDFTSLEALIKVPFRLHTFLEHFKFEGEKGFHIEKIYDEQNDQIIQFGELIYEPLLIDDEKVKIESFLKEDEFLKSIQMLAENPLWINHRMIPIGRTKNGYQIGVKIDLLDDQKEEVWLVRDASSTLERENTIKLSDDIFKFIRGLVAAYDHNYFERIYQKWGEDFWRIKSN